MIAWSSHGLGLLLATSAPLTAEDVLAAHRARTSMSQGGPVEACGAAMARSDEEVIVCGRRPNDRYRVEPSIPDPTGRPGSGGLETMNAARGTFGTCDIGANLCEKPMVDIFRVADVLIKGIKALTDGE